ncbi:hypothetical protein F4703DRAFT_1868674 [Phycomyces blakesleeanus]
MQPHLNELDHWRNTSQRAIDQTQKKPANTRHRSNQDDNPKQFFALDSSRGWLETSPIKNTPSSLADGQNGWSLERESSSESQNAKDMLGAVSNADILMLTKMTSNLSHQIRKFPVKDSRSIPAETKTIRSNATKENVSVSLENHNNTFATPDTLPSTASIPTRTSHSTPPSSSLSKESWNGPEYRQSWYKSLIKRDSKLKHNEDESSCDDDMYSYDNLLANKPGVKRATSSERLRKLAANTPLKSRFWYTNKHHRMGSSSAQPLSTGSQDKIALKKYDRRHSLGSISSTEFIAQDSQEWYEDEYEYEDEGEDEGERKDEYGDGDEAAEPKVEADRYSDTRIGTERETEVGAEADTKEEVETKAEKEAGTEAETGIGVEVEKEAEGEPEYESKEKAKIKLKSEAKSVERENKLVEEGLEETEDEYEDEDGYEYEHEDEDEEEEDEDEDEDEVEGEQPIEELRNEILSQSKQSLGTDESNFEDHENPIQDSPYTERLGTAKTLLFDYDTLPSEITVLLKEYEREGRMRVRHNETTAVEEYDNSDTELDELEVISGGLLLTEEKHGRNIVEVQASSSDRIEFVKLVQLPDDMLVENGRLFDLHVSLLTDNCENEEVVNSYEGTIALSKSVNKRMKDIKGTLTDCQEFLDMQRCDISSLSLDDFDQYGRPVAPSRPASTFDCQNSKVYENPSEKRTLDSLLDNPSHSTLVSNSVFNSPGTPNSCSSVKRAPSLLLNNIPFRGVNPFDYRKDDVRLGVAALQSELDGFKAALENTERLVRRVQADVDQTRSRMELLIKNIPESNFSALKRLEVDIEYILASRAKNPWLDTAYALLSYLLTVFALGVWTVICILKYGRRVFSFPWRLWRDYKAHMRERNKAVKQASLYSLSGTSSSRARQI